MPRIRPSPKAAEGSRYEELLWVNSFQYPPMKPVPPSEQTALCGRLALDKPMPSPSIFTIFVSIPYCRTRCHSCEYFKSLLPRHIDSRAFLDEYLDCLERQMQQYGTTKRFCSATCAAVYIGGGTASLLFPDQVKRVIDALRRYLPIASNAEITLEGNPHEFSSPGYLKMVKESGVTRVSIGYQSSYEAILKALNAPHNASESTEAVRNAMATGFSTVNIDLLYRVPSQTLEQWRHDLQTAIDFEPEGITISEYRVHPSSASERLIARGSLPQPVDRDTAHEWYLWARAQLEHSGYLEQRKGSFSKPGHDQQYAALTYGVSYGEACESIALGAGAFSFVNRYQFGAPKDAELFKDQIHRGDFPVVDRVSVQASDHNMMERYIIFSFASSSLSRTDFCRLFGQNPLAVFPHIFAKLERRGLVVVNEHEIKLTSLGISRRYNVFYEFYLDTFKVADRGYVGESGLLPVAQ